MDSLRYTKETFDQLMRYSYGYDIDVQSICSNWRLVRELYEKNYIQDTSKDIRIPKKIHQVWLGGQIPKQYELWGDSWKRFHPDWEYKLWTDADINKINITRRDMFDYAVNPGMKSDILRYEVINQFGGVYIDTDFECLKSFDDLLYLDFFTSLSYDTKMELYIGLIASIPNHPIMQKCTSVFNRFYNGTKGSRILDVTGSYHFTRCFLKTVNRDSQKIVAFPMNFFYPYPNNVRYTEEAKDHIKSESYAVHHWEVSWMGKKGVKL